MKRLLPLVALLSISVIVIACGEEEPEQTAVAPAAVGGQIEPEAKMLSRGDEPSPPMGALDTSKTYTATFDTEAGEFKILLFDD